MRLAHKINFPKGFAAVYPSYDWLSKWYLFLDEQQYKIYGSYDAFVRDYLDPHTLVVEGPGIVLRFLGVDSWHMADVHGFITSKDAFKMVPQLNELGRVIMDSFKLVRLEIRVPAFLKGVNRLLENVGFVREGALRNLGKDGMMFYDMNVYSMIDEG